MLDGKNDSITKVPCPLEVAASLKFVWAVLTPFSVSRYVMESPNHGGMDPTPHEIRNSDIACVRRDQPAACQHQMALLAGYVLAAHVRISRNALPVELSRCRVQAVTQLRDVC